MQSWDEISNGESVVVVNLGEGKFGILKPATRRRICEVEVRLFQNYKSVVQ